MLRNIAVPAVVLAVAIVVPSGPVWAAGPLDQEQAVIGQGGNVLYSGSSAAQTFTAGRSGALDQVDVAIDVVGTPDAPLLVEIRDTVSGVPGTTVLSTVSVAPAGVPAAGTPVTFVSIALTSVATVHAGTRYALTLSTAGRINAGAYEWFRTTTFSPDLYPAGVAFIGNVGSGSWTGLGTADFAFRTYVSPVDTTPPTVTITNPHNGALHLRNAIVTADYGCADEPGGSGIATCAGPVPDGAAIDTATTGVKTFTVTATDHAGNTASATTTYQVCNVIVIVDPVLRLCL